MAKTVVLGITGSIAAYKAAEIGSRLKKEGVEVFPVLTENAARFITPLTMETICGRPAVESMWDRNAPHEVEHISLAKRADLFLIAPASANFMGKYVGGIADDMLTTSILATKAPVLIAPAMNTGMYQHAAVQENMQRLRERGCLFIQPEAGLLACGDVGVGRLAEVSDIVERALGLLCSKPKDLAGKKVIVTAGPTKEAFDPVRYISNRSSGKMGFAIATAARDRGAQVVLVSGPVELTPPRDVEFVPVVSTSQMRDAVLGHFEDCDIVIKAAAPADFMPAEVQDNKIKKGGKDYLSVQMVPTPDILQELGERKKGQILVGFAAETQDVIAYAMDKLERKNLDMIVANDVTLPGSGFGSDTNIVTMITRKGRKALDRMGKAQVAHHVLDEVLALGQ
ncbi:MAG: bifunctional phosphopantothenoylcysteine decarboxylase/phosphopantothenate--cysteine ligase CoaBC [Christensenellales bacterium]|jgi:phosphopantothenoylcysteine decarboxylase/phosphopantothenate--cysteine ligase